jgi:hypothetical protein
MSKGNLLYRQCYINFSITLLLDDCFNIFTTSCRLWTRSPQLQIYCKIMNSPIDCQENCNMDNSLQYLIPCLIQHNFRKLGICSWNVTRLEDYYNSSMLSDLCWKTADPKFCTRLLCILQAYEIAKLKCYVILYECQEKRLGPVSF